MEEKFNLIGDLNNIKNQLSLQGLNLTTRETEELIDILKEYSKQLEPDELFEDRVRMPRQNGRYLSFMILEHEYHICISRLCLYFLVKLTNRITFELSEKIFDWTAPDIINRIDEINGEKCVIEEALQHDRLGTDKVFDKNNGQCCNFNLKCHFRQDEKCTCTKSDLTKIYESLTKRGVMKRTDNGYKIRL